MKVSDDFNYVHKELDFHKLPYKEEIERSTSIDRAWTWRQSVVPNDAPRDFCPEVAFGAKFRIPVARQ